MILRLEKERKSGESGIIAVHTLPAAGHTFLYTIYQFDDVQLSHAWLVPKHSADDGSAVIAVPLGLHQW